MKAIGTVPMEHHPWWRLNPMKDFILSETKGDYWITVDKEPNGDTRMAAVGPIAGVFGWVAPIARSTASTEAEAERLLRAELQRMNA